MPSLLSLQYDMVLDSRNVLLQYCDTVSAEDFVRSSPNFGKGGSIRNMLVHICNTYQGWLAPHVPGKQVMEVEHTDMPTLKECRNYFRLTNEVVIAFIERYGNNSLDPLPAEAGRDDLKLTPLKLFTHVITHEFHHKGQVLSLSRLWGYIPIDTDILR